MSGFTDTSFTWLRDILYYPGFSRGKKKQNKIYPYLNRLVVDDDR